MILIWGFRALSKTTSEGTFFCPNEGGDRTYRRRTARRWFTLFFLPVFPLEELGEYVECSGCQATYYPDVLSAPTTAQIEDVLTIGLRHLVVAMITADGHVDPAERDYALTLMSKYANHPYTGEDLDHDLAALRSTDLEDKLEELGGILNETGRESLVRACVELAGADGTIDATEIDVAKAVGHALSMSPAHIRGVVESTREQLGVEST